MGQVLVAGNKKTTEDCACNDKNSVDTSLCDDWNSEMKICLAAANLNGDVLNKAECSAAIQNRFNGNIIIGLMGGKSYIGDQYDTSLFYSSTFKYPKEYGEFSEFLFDFCISAPISGISTLSIHDSKLTTHLSAVPDSVSHVYEISDASLFQSDSKSIKIRTGDRVVLKNVSNRYIVVEFIGINSKITTLSGVDTEKVGVHQEYFDYAINMKFYVNVSSNMEFSTLFSPTETSVVLPPIIFKKNVRELFDSMVHRLDVMASLKEKLKQHPTDSEITSKIELELAKLKSESNSLPFYEEHNRLKVQRFTINRAFNKIKSNNVFDFKSLTPSDDMTDIIYRYRNGLDSSKEFMYDVNGVVNFEFDKTLIDTGILVDLYSDLEAMLGILLDTFDYMMYDEKYFVEKIHALTIVNIDIVEASALTGIPFIIYIVKKLRREFYRLKMLINLRIMHPEYPIKWGAPFNHTTVDLDGNISATNSEDFYLLYKKAELVYGKSVDKYVSTFGVDVEFFERIVSMEKVLFDACLTLEEKAILAGTINELELKLTETYDDFFLFHLWLDYLNSKK